MSSRTDLTKMGKHIFDLRKGLGYTQKQLGEMLDVSDKTVSKWEQGDVAPDITILTSLAKALNVSVNEILYGEKEEPKIEDEKSLKLLNLYTKQMKLSLVRKILVISFAVFVFVVLGFYLNGYSRWKVTRLSIDNDYNITGFMVTNTEESKVVLNHITYVSEKEEKIIISEIDIKILYEGKVIYKKTTILDKPMDITNVFSNYVIAFEIKKSLTRDNLSIVIDCLDIDNLHNIFTSDF